MIALPQVNCEQPGQQPFAGALSSSLLRQGPCRFRRRRLCPSLGLGLPRTKGLAQHEYAKILEFSAGLGQTLAAVSATTKWAVDINPQSKIACEAKGIKWSDSLDAVPDQAFDLIISRHSLKHVPTPYDTLQALRRKITPEGRIILVVPLEDCAMPDATSAFDKHCHLFSWTPMTLKNLLLATDRKIESLKLHNNLMFHRSLALPGIGSEIFLAFRELMCRFGPLRSPEIVAVCSPTISTASHGILAAQCIPASLAAEPADD